MPAELLIAWTLSSPCLLGWGLVMIDWVFEFSWQMRLEEEEAEERKNPRNVVQKKEDPTCFFSSSHQDIFVFLHRPSSNLLYKPIPSTYQGESQCVAAAASSTYNFFKPILLPFSAFEAGCNCHQFGQRGVAFETAVKRSVCRSSLFETSAAAAGDFAAYKLINKV